MKDTDRYYSLNKFLRKKFHQRVHKLSIDAGFSCPNKENGKSGCIFCNSTSFSPGSKFSHLSVTEQLDEEIKRVSRRFHVDKFLAYFQPNTNTYADSSTLYRLYEEALKHPKVVGLVIGTRPDCVGDEVLDVIKEVSSLYPDKWVELELGLQSIDNNILNWMRRDHSLEDFTDACSRIKRYGFSTGVHIIWGTPFDIKNEDLIIKTASFLSQIGIFSVKIHNLYVPTHTVLADMYLNNMMEIYSKKDYIDTVILFLEHLSSDIVVERLVSDVPADCLLAPLWLTNKNEIMEEIIDELEKQDSYQGKRCSQTC